jgi:hypothetical protein
MMPLTILGCSLAIASLPPVEATTDPITAAKHPVRSQVEASVVPAPKPEEKKASPSQKDCCFLELKGAYFYPTADRFKSHYSGNGIYGLEFDFRLKKDFFGWAAANYFSQNSHTTDGSATHLIMAPMTIGLKWLYTAYSLQPYLGIGAAATFMRERTDDPNLKPCMHHWGYGGIFRGGLQYSVGRFFLDGYADYYKSSVRFPDRPHAAHYQLIHSIDISGISFGGGLGCWF